MPAIDPRKLGEQLSEAVARVEQPEELVKALRDIFAFYADRTKRASDVLHSDDTIPRYGTPKPVVRQARRALQSRMLAEQLDVEPLIRALWQGGERELRLLAVALLAELEWDRRVEWTRELIATNQDPQIVEALAQHGLSGWRQVPDAVLMSLFEEWLSSDNGQLQRLSLLLLLQHINAASSDWLPRYFELLTGAAEKLNRRAQPTLRKVIRRLAAWNPAETAQFLLDEGRGNNWQPPYRQFVEEVVDYFPGAQQRELRSTLMLQ